MYSKQKERNKLMASQENLEKFIIDIFNCKISDLESVDKFYSILAIDSGFNIIEELKELPRLTIDNISSNLMQVLQRTLYHKIHLFTLEDFKNNLFMDSQLNTLPNPIQDLICESAKYSLENSLQNPLRFLNILKNLNFNNTLEDNIIRIINREVDSKISLYKQG